MQTKKYQSPTIKHIQLGTHQHILQNSNNSPQNLDEGGQTGRSYNPNDVSYSRRKSSIWTEN